MCMKKITLGTGVNVLKKLEITKITVIKYLTYFDVERRFFKSKEHVPIPTAFRRSLSDL